MNNPHENLVGAGLGEYLPSADGRAMTRDRTLAGSEEEIYRAPIQLADYPVAASSTAKPVDPFDIFNSAPAPVLTPAPTTVFGFSNQPAAAPAVQAAANDPFAAFQSAPVRAPAPAPLPAADDPFAGFAPVKPAVAPVAAAAPAAAAWGFPDDDFFDFNQSTAAPTASAHAAKATSVPDVAALSIKDKPPPLPSEGPILARLSARSLFAKDWSESYWVIRGYHVFIYRSFDDYKYAEQGENVKKEILITAKMRTLPIKKKDYSNFGQLHNFFLEEVEDYGANQICKFASRDLKDLEILCQQINRRIRKLKGA